MRTVAVSIGMIAVSAVIWHYTPNWIAKIEKGEITGTATGDWIVSATIFVFGLYLFYSISKNYVHLPFVQFYT